MRRFANRTIKVLAALWLAVGLQLLPFLPNLSVRAAITDWTGKLTTAVTLTDGDGNPVGTNAASEIGVGEELYILYEFDVPGTSGVTADDTFTLQVPTAISGLAATVNQPIYVQETDGTKTQVGKYTLTTGGALTVTFTEDITSDTSIGVWFKAGLSRSMQLEDSPSTIAFEVIGTSAPYTITVYHETADPVPPTVAKAGSAYNKATHTIDWTLTVTPNEVNLAGATITDTLADGLEPVTPLAANYSYNSATRVLTYTFPSTPAVTTVQTLTFPTTVTNDKLDELAQKTSDSGKKISNTATLHYGDGNGQTVVSNTPSVTVPVSYISKAGQVLSTSNNRVINWTIAANPDSFTINGATVTDTLPSGLSLLDDVTYQVKVNGTAITTSTASTPYYSYDAGTRKIIVTLGNITGPQQITFSTQAAESLFQGNGSNYNITFQNTAKLNGTMPDGGSGVAVDVGTPTVSVSVSTNILSKNGTYNKATGTIAWTVTVNTNNTSLTNAIVTDTLPTGVDAPQNVKWDGTALILAADADSLSTSSYFYNPTGRVLTYKAFNTNDTATHTLTFTTQITDPALWKTNQTLSYTNQANLAADGGISANATKTVSAANNVIKKENAGYDYVTRRLSWKVTINGDAKPLPAGAVFTDVIPLGQTYVAGSARIGSATDDMGFTYTAVPEASQTASTGTGTLSYLFTSAINTAYVITFQTEVTDLTVFKTNANVSFSNTGSFTHTDLGSNPAITSTANKTVNNAVVSKKGQAYPTDNYIEWTVHVNSNNIPLELLGAGSKIKLTDQLVDGLRLEPQSVQLWREHLNADGSYAAVTDADKVTLTKDDITYNLATNEFNLYLPNPITTGYKLVFSTSITNKAKSPFSNTIAFNGTNTTEEKTDNVANNSWAAHGSWATRSGGGGGLGEIKIKKESDDGKALAGAVFELYGLYDLPVQQATSSSDGWATFKDVPYGTYTVKELSAPTGYLVNTDTHTAVLASASYTDSVPFVNQTIRGSIAFDKLDGEGNGLPGATFTLYAADDTDFSDPIDTATSGTDGAVLFEDVAYGDYAIRETTAPTGYVLSSTVLTASIRLEGSTVTASPASVSNRLIAGTVTLSKKGESGDALEGAAFALYAKADTDFATPLYTASSDSAGLVTFPSVLYGEYVLRETVAPTGYTLWDGSLPVTVDTDGHTYDLGEVSDTRIRADIEVLKTNIVDDPLARAEFTLYAADDTDFSDPLATALSADDGIARFADVLFGDYTIRETAAPEQYVASDEVLTAHVTADGVTLHFTVVNDRSDEHPWGTVSVAKADQDGAALAGATFALYAGADTALTTPLATAVSGADGVATFAPVPPGIYLVQETIAPTGYRLNDTVLTVTVGTLPQTYLAGTVVDQPYLGAVEILKKNVRDEVLAGAEFTLYEIDGMVVAVATTGEDGLARFTDIPYGSYTIVETKAPHKYEASPDAIPVTISEDGQVVRLTVVDDRSDQYPWEDDLPDAGDWVAAALVAFVGSGVLLTVLLVVERRRKRHN